MGAPLMRGRSTGLTQPHSLMNEDCVGTEDVMTRRQPHTPHATADASSVPAYRPSPMSMIDKAFERYWAV